jgi:hypothetical protein
MRIRLTVIIFTFAFSHAMGQQWQAEATANRGRMQYYAGTIGPDANLGYSVRSSAGGGWMWQLVDYTNASFLNVKYPNGYVGLGVSNPLAKLHISNANAREALRVYLDGNTTNYLSMWQGSGAAAIDPIGTGKIYIGYDMSTDIFLSSNGGNVGVGTSSPLSKLHVAGGDVLLQNTSSGYPRLWLKDVTGTNTLKLDYNSMIGTGVNLLIRSGTGTNLLLNDQAGGGKVGIGTTNPDQKLTVKGKIHAEEVIIDLAVPAPDYVFEKLYDLKSLDEVKKYIDENKHLPEVPSAKEMEKDGVKVGEMEMILLKKIEELTLYMIENKGEIEKLKQQNLLIRSENLHLLKMIANSASNKK